jgi:hypothetical protein
VLSAGGMADAFCRVAAAHGELFMVKIFHQKMMKKDKR